MKIPNNEMVKAINKAYGESGGNAYFTQGFLLGCNFGIKKFKEQKNELKQLVLEFGKVYGLNIEDEDLFDLYCTKLSEKYQVIIKEE